MLVYEFTPFTGLVSRFRKLVSQAQTARYCKVSKATVSRWVARYHADGEAAFKARFVGLTPHQLRCARQLLSWL
ncbi:MAG: helix-turn-helix domain-containing protein [Acidimicrobiia bacterium]|nr:helix-turn-helix domain-containing protein [Acidimicrobiia bacterium]